MSKEAGAGAPELNAEIEITPEMLEAGVDVLLGELGDGVSSFWCPRDLAMKVFLAMVPLSKYFDLKQPRNRG